MIILALAQESMSPWALAILVGLLFLVGLFVVVRSEPDRPNEVRLRVASRLGGQVVRSVVRFEVGGRKAALERWGSRNNPGTQVVVDVWGLSPGSLHILREGFGQSFLKWLGVKDLEIGDPVFDAAYIVRAMPEALAARVFSPERRTQAMASVRRLRNLVDPTIELDAYCLMVRCRSVVEDESGLMALAETAKDFCDYLMDLRSANPVVLGDVQAVPGGACPVCGTALYERIIHCESCRTPHHSECWQYMGTCATYACSGKRFLA